MEKFWMVWNEGNRSPAFKHWTADSAMIEAERLARQNPGQKFHVLELVDSCRVKDVFWASEQANTEPRRLTIDHR